MVKINERGSSLKDPFTRGKVKGYHPLMIRIVVKRGRGIEVVKVVLKVVRVDGAVLERCSGSDKY